jgi:hypothetical protein
MSNFSSRMDNDATYSVCCEAGKINNTRKTPKFATPRQGGCITRKVEASKIIPATGKWDDRLQYRSDV